MNEERVIARLLPNIKFDGCWIWLGTPDSNGYGRIAIDGKRDKVHRWMWKVCIGPLSSECDLDHDWSCKNKLCCNPDHLEPVSHGENSRRSQGVFNGICKNGHRIEGYNKQRTSQGFHQCRICHVNVTRKWRQQNHIFGTP